MEGQDGRYSVTVEAVTITGRKRDDADPRRVWLSGAVTVSARSPEIEATLRVPFERAETLDKAVELATAELRAWCRGISAATAGV